MEPTSSEYNFILGITAALWLLTLVVAVLIEWLRKSKPIYHEVTLKVQNEEGLPTVVLTLEEEEIDMEKYGKDPSPDELIEEITINGCGREDCPRMFSMSTSPPKCHKCGFEYQGMLSQETED